MKLEEISNIQMINKYEEDCDCGLALSLKSKKLEKHSNITFDQLVAKAISQVLHCKAYLVFFSTMH